MMQFGRSVKAVVGAQRRLNGGRSQQRVRGNVSGNGSFGVRTRARVGDVSNGTGCGDMDNDTGRYANTTGNPWCYNPQQWAPVPMGPNAIINTITAATAGPPLVPGTGTLTFAAVEQVIVFDLELTDPSGALLVTTVVSGRYPIPEAGNFPANMFQSASTAYKFCRGVPIYPSSPLVITFANPTLAAVNVQGGLQVIIVPCALNLPPSLVAMLKQ